MLHAMSEGLFVSFELSGKEHTNGKIPEIGCFIGPQENRQRTRQATGILIDVAYIFQR